MGWRRFFRRTRWDAERASEMESYITIETDENIARGMNPREAREAAMRKLGNTTLVREEIYHMNSLPILERLWQDTRYAFRLFAKTPAVSALIILTLALGIGGNAAIFSIVNAVLLKPLPYPEPERLVMVLEKNQKDDRTWIVSAPAYLDWEKQAQSFERMVIYEYLNFNLSGNAAQPEGFSGLRVSAGVPEVTGVQPKLGRWFTRDEEPPGRNNVVVLSYDLWQRRYQGAQDVVGRTIRVNQLPHTVIGVMPQGFAFPATRQQLWVPIAFNERDLQCRDCHSFWASARLKRGVTFEQARAEIDTIGRNLEKAYPEDHAGETATVTPMRNLFLGDLRPTLMMLLLAVAFVLLIACVNIANLLMARCSARQKELAVRTALGAGRARLAAQLLTESVLLSLIGTALGVAVAIAMVPVMISTFPGLRNLPFRDMQNISMDWRVFGFTLAVALATGLLAGLLPAWQTMRSAPGDFLKEGSRGSTAGGGKRLRSVLIGVEVALALVVLTGAGLMVASISRLVQVDPGLNPKGVFLLGVSLPQRDFYGPPERKRFCQDVQEQVSAIAGVTAVSAVSHTPLSGANAGRGFVIEGQPDPGRENPPGASYGLICPDYFRTMEIKLKAGRDFNHQDSTGAPAVAIVNEEFVRRFFSNEDPLGRRIKLGRFTSPNNWITIVGVAGDVKHWGLDDQRKRPYLYRPYSQAAWPGMSVVVRTPSNAAVLSETVRQALMRIEPEQPVSKMVTIEGIVEGSLGTRNFPMRVLASFGVMALVLAAIGIYGMVSYSVAQRTQEIGIRMALGALPRDAYRMVVSQAMLPVLLGVLAGLAGAYAATRSLQTLLWEVTATDPATFATVTALLVAVAAAACFVPARRAAKVDPLTALRYE